MKKLSLFLILMTCMTWTRAQDLALAAPFGALTAPVNGCNLSSTENITVRIFNFGPTLPGGTSFNVTYTVNGGMPTTEMVVLGSSLLANSSFNYTFVTQANLSIPGTYILSATVTLPGDINTTNNAIPQYNVTNTAGSVGGNVSGSAVACATGNSGTLSLSGYTGTIIRWEYSNDDGNTWYYISNTTETQSYSNLKKTTRYRAVIRNGSCNTVFSSMAIITINC